MKITPKWILTKFEKLRGTDTYAKRWDELTPDSRFSLLGGISLDGDEIPVVAITAEPNPVIVTTKRIIWRSDGSQHQVPVTELASLKSLEYFHTSKLDMSKVVVTTSSGQEHVIQTGPGGTLFILWNLLLMFTRVRAGTLKS
jgi:hypothetical protein